jgi:hypothetical protein
MAIDDIGSKTPGGLRVNNHAVEFLREAAKWTGFLAIIGFIGIGLMVIGALFFGTILASLGGAGAGLGGAVGGGFITVIYLLVAALYFFPVYYMYKFSVNMKRALQMNDEDTLTKAFEYLKSHYKFIGILTIVLLSFYLLLFLIGLLGAAASF